MKTGTSNNFCALEKIELGVLKLWVYICFPGLKDEYQWFGNVERNTIIYVFLTLFFSSLNVL